MRHKITALLFIIAVCICGLYQFAHGNFEAGALSAAVALLTLATYSIKKRNENHD